MSRDRADEAAADSDRHVATYVYGIVPADVEPEQEATGIGDPPGKVDVVRYDEIGALVSEIPDRPLGTPADLTAHAKLLDGSAAVVPVLPLRFGAVMTDPGSVETELLQTHHDEFRAALEELEGRAQYVVKGRYAEKEILGEVLAENGEAARLRERIRDTPQDAARDARMELGEIIYRAVENKRAADTRRTIDALEPLRPVVNERQPTHDQDAVHIAVLVEVSRQGELEEAVSALADEWDGRVDLHLLGPMAAYDFVMKREPEG
ncbi:GvpL/GvpF family gas vesicle protein [Nocardia sp. NBC_00416]|uniref:GvpL/GvpF family gas vesicle protein n=1 Tax=Nocardia sp. NBC_00416 TaxID=2975991 RepID=UPI002E2390ED